MKNSSRSINTVALLAILSLLVAIGFGALYITGMFNVKKESNSEIKTDSGTDPVITNRTQSTDTATDLTKTAGSAKTRRRTPNQSIPTTTQTKSTPTTRSTPPENDPPTPIVTASPTPTLTPTPVPGNKSNNKTTDRKYFEFAFEFQEELRDKAIVPIRLKGILVEDGTMWVVHNGTSPLVNDTRMRQEWISIAWAYTQAWNDHEAEDLSGVRPDKLRYVEFNDSQEKTNDSTFFIPTSDVRAVWEENMSVGEFNTRWFRRLRDTTKYEERKADSIAGDTTNSTYYPEGWNESDEGATDTAGARPVPEFQFTTDRHGSGHGSRKARAVGQ